MKCKKCGGPLLEGDRFCVSCGETVPESIIEIKREERIEKDFENKPKSKKWSFLMILGLLILLGAILLIGILGFSYYNAKELICSSSNQSITIKYSNIGLISYKAVDMDFDLKSERKEARKLGISQYIKDYQTKFIFNTGGSCSHTGEEKEERTEVIETKTVGNEEFGYVTVPKDWITFEDIESSSAIQFTDTGIYIISLDYIRDPKYTAEQYAKMDLFSRKDSEKEEQETASTIQIGNNKEYTAYQVYSYYKNENSFLITYWLESEDGKIRCISLEGPETFNEKKLTDYLFIPESYHISNS